MHEFYMGTKIVYGVGSRTAVVSILKENGWSRVGAIVDHNLAENALIKDVLSSITGAGVTVTLGYCTISEPTYDFLDNIRGTFHGKNLQAIIGIGGGSALDTAKAIAVLANNNGPSITYRGFNKMTEPVLPVIAIPTTAGTGSEITPNASFIDTDQKRKMGINGEAVRPRYAVLDPELTLSCPAGPTISAGVDSMVHAVEAYVAKKTNPLAKMFAKEGFRLVLFNLPRVIKEPSNIGYREKVMLGAFLSGVALMNSGTGPAAALSYPMGIHFKVHHGIGGGMFLPHVVLYNINGGYYEYAGLDPDTSAHEEGAILADKEKAERFAEKIFSVWRELSIPRDLAGTGMTDDFTGQFIRETLELKGALDQNPVLFGEDAIRSILRSMGLGKVKRCRDR